MTFHTCRDFLATLESGWRRGVAPDVVSAAAGKADAGSKS
jgi:hypothetical protein